MKQNFTIGVVDTGAGNIFSLLACLKRIGMSPVVISTAEALQQNTAIDALLIPGQGRFGTVMQKLQSNELDKAIISWIESGKPLLGICVGQQVLFEASEEDQNKKGLGILSGTVTRLESPKQPIVGWCSLDSDDELLNDKVVYFVNSYAVKSSANAIASVTYGEQFVVALRYKNAMTFQFHPEKSGEAGEQILHESFSRMITSYQETLENENDDE